MLFNFDLDYDNTENQEESTLDTYEPISDHITYDRFYENCKRHIFVPLIPFFLLFLVFALPGVELQNSNTLVLYLLLAEALTLMWCDPFKFDSLAPRSKKLLTVSFFTMTFEIHYIANMAAYDCWFSLPVSFMLVIISGSFGLMAIRWNSNWMNDYKILYSQLQKVAMLENKDSAENLPQSFRSWNYYGERETVTMIQEFFRIRIDDSNFNLVKRSWILGFINGQDELKKEMRKARQAQKKAENAIENQKNRNIELQYLQQENDELREELERYEEQSSEYAELRMRLRETEFAYNHLLDQYNQILRVNQELTNISIDVDTDQEELSDETIWKLNKEDKKTYQEIAEMYGIDYKMVKNAMIRYNRKQKKE